MIDYNDLIIGDDYRKLCDYDYNGENLGDIPPDNTVVHVPMDLIKEFFQVCEWTDNSYVVVSPRSDFGVFYQQTNPIWFDMKKWLYMMAHGVHMPQSELGMSDLVVPKRCSKDCDSKDKFIVKCWAWSKSTFPAIPKNVIQWYGNNMGIDEENCCGMPFGVWDKEEVQLLQRFKNSKKDGLLYVNFALNNQNRIMMDKWFATKQFKWATYREKSNLPREEFLGELSSHKFCLCPEGNGVDCYRVWESLAMGVIPIVRLDPVTKWFSDLPILFFDNQMWQELFAQNKVSDKVFQDTLNGQYFELKDKWDNMSGDVFSQTYWRNKFREKLQILLTNQI